MGGERGEERKGKGGEGRGGCKQKGKWIGDVWRAVWVWAAVRMKVSVNVRVRVRACI